MLLFFTFVVALFTRIVPYALCREMPMKETDFDGAWAMTRIGRGWFESISRLFCYRRSAGLFVFKWKARCALSHLVAVNTFSNILPKSLDGNTLSLQFSRLHLTLVLMLALTKSKTKIISAKVLDDTGAAGHSLRKRRPHLFHFWFLIEFNFLWWRDLRLFDIHCVIPIPNRFFVLEKNWVCFHCRNWVPSTRQRSCGHCV